MPTLQLASEFLNPGIIGSGASSAVAAVWFAGMAALGRTWPGDRTADGIEILTNLISCLDSGLVSNLLTIYSSAFPVSHHY